MLRLGFLSLVFCFVSAASIAAAQTPTPSGGGQRTSRAASSESVPVDRRVPAFVEPVSFDPAAGTIATDEIAFERHVRVDGNRLQIVATYRTLRDAVEADRVDAYRRTIDRVGDLCGFEIFRDDETEQREEATARSLWLGIPVAILCLLIAVPFGSAAVGRVRAKRRTSRNRARGRSPLGEGADSPIEVGTVDDARRAASALQCCADVRRSDERWTRARLGERELTIYSAGCESCRRTVRRYFLVEERLRAAASSVGRGE